MILASWWLYLCVVPPTFNQVWSVWPVEYCGYDDVWFPNLGYKSIVASDLSSWFPSSMGSQVCCDKDTQAALCKDPGGEEISNTECPAVWHLEVDNWSPVKPSDDYISSWHLIVTTRETPSQNFLAKTFMNCLQKYEK